MSTPPEKLKTYVSNPAAVTVKQIPAKQWRDVLTSDNQENVECHFTGINPYILKKNATSQKR